MALYSLVVESEGNSYSTQVAAESARMAVNEYFRNVYPRSSAEAFGLTAPILSAQDILHIRPMDGLVNMWVCCAGREGKYVSVVCSRTESIQEE
jgi:hypothetical protein